MTGGGIVSPMRKESPEMPEQSLHTPRTLISLLWAVIAFLLMAQSAAAATYQRGEAPSWVRTVAVPYEAQAPSSQVVSGSYMLLYDRQVRADGTRRADFYRFATRALNEQGVAAISSIEIAFDPAYQTLTLHEVRVIRGQQVQNRTPTMKVDILRREKGLDFATLDGRVSAHIVLDDIRVGDVLQYAYTIGGKHPTLGAHDAGLHQLAFGVPVERVFLRVLLPENRDFKLAVSNGGPAPQQSVQDGFIERVWSRDKVQAMQVEGDAPGWYVPFPIVQWSSFGDWQQVARWGEALYRTPAQASSAALRKARNIAAAHPRPADRLVEALRVAQRDVRYFGVQIGASSLRPAPPDEVLARGFGDCKGKTLLLLTLLRHLGIQAEAALVSTQFTQGIENFQPSHITFDHVLVRAVLDGKVYWLDPTRATQGATLDKLYQPDFGLALVLRGDTARPESMREPARVFARRVVTAIDSRAGLDAPVGYTVSTTVSGMLAEDLRFELSLNSPENIEKNYLNYYARYFPGIRVVRAMDVTDDVAQNRITTTEHYEIADFWTTTPDGLRRDAELLVPEVIESLRRPALLTRSAPMAISRNAELDVTTDVALPSDWSIRPDRQEVKDAHFTFQREVSYTDRRLTLHDLFRYDSDHVAPEQLASYVSSLDRARNAATYSLYHTDLSGLSVGDRMNWPIATIALIMAAALCILARRLYRYDPPPPAFMPVAGLSGISGWLVLVALQQILQPLRLGVGFSALIGTYSIQNWNMLTQPGADAYHVLWAPILLFELAANLTLIIGAVLSAVLFFQRRTSAPLFVVCFLWLVPALAITDTVVSGLVLPEGARENQMSQIVGALVGAAIWTAYFQVSKRVKSTFRRTLREPVEHSRPEATEPPPTDTTESARA